MRSQKLDTKPKNKKYIIIQLKHNILHNILSGYSFIVCTNHNPRLQQYRRLNVAKVAFPEYNFVLFIGQFQRIGRILLQ